MEGELHAPRAIGLRIAVTIVAGLAFCVLAAEFANFSALAAGWLASFPAGAWMRAVGVGLAGAGTQVAPTGCGLA